MKTINCTESDHSQAILDILNQAIVSSTALFDYTPRPLESMKNWFEVKRENEYPVKGLVNGAGDLLGFVTYGQFRPFPAFKYTMEHSIYVHPDHQGKGLGDQLLETIIVCAKEQGKHVLVGGIEASNQASIRLHEKHGFTCSGIIKDSGFKFGRWLDLAFYQLVLATPENPEEG